jgi:hypothetical protein
MTHNNQEGSFDEEQFFEAVDERTLAFCFSCAQQSLQWCHCGGIGLTEMEDSHDAQGVDDESSQASSSH